MPLISGVLVEWLLISNQAVELVVHPPGTRTRNPLIKSQSPNPLNTRFFNSLLRSKCVRVCHVVSQ